MKEYSVITTKVNSPVAVLTIKTEQIDSMTEEKVKDLINKWLLIVGANCSIKYKQGDFDIKYRDKSETLVFEEDKTNVIITLYRLEETFDIADNSQIICFD